MAEVIKMPRLSDTMEEGLVTQWHKRVGDRVEEGDILAEIETDKAVQEFESFYTGTLRYVGVKEGERASVDAVLAVIGDADEDIKGLIAQGEDGGSAIGKAGVEEKAVKPVSAAGKAGVEEKAVKPLTDRILASPLARKMARESGVDLGQVQGSGDNGRIVKSDVARFKPARRQTAYIPQSVESQEVAVSQLRKTIAARLTESKFTAPHYYLNIAVDMENASVSREQVNAMPGAAVSFNDVIIKATAMALRQHPQVNSSWAGDTVIQHGDIHIGMAVAVEAGLLVPVIKNADYKGMLQISAEAKDLAEKAKTRKIAADEMTGSTFTISNLGMFGIESFTSIINQPNSCILSVGAIVEKPVVKKGQIAVGHTLQLTMACDHRTVDGATAAAFLQTLKTMLETPLAMLM
ncbi:MAG: dihydrolipoamide acetyltransferase family protein [Flavobacteriales bacterium]